MAVLFTPNLSSYTGQKVAPYILPYMYALGLPGIWSFFAPEPFSPPVYLDYVLTKENGEEVSGRFPSSEHYSFRARQNRWYSFTSYLLKKTFLIEHMFMNFLCRQHKNVYSAKIWSIQGLQPSLKMVQQGAPISKTIDFQTEFIGDFVCTGEEDTTKKE